MTCPKCKLELKEHRDCTTGTVYWKCPRCGFEHRPEYAGINGEQYTPPQEARNG